MRSADGTPRFPLGRKARLTETGARLRHAETSRRARRQVARGAVLIIALAGVSRGAAGQATWLPRMRLDNDAYDFWRRPGQRPDDEYTNGVRLSLESASAPWWGRHFAAGRHDCAERLAEPAPCRATVLTLGQDLYTPRLDRAPFSAPDWQAERPYFAWLYLSGEARLIGARSIRTIALSLGVTGPPAGGELAQKVAHAVNRGFTRPATGWNTQIGFEPGIVASLRQRILAARLGAESGLGFDFAPSAGVSLGNILTSADAGGVVRLGWNLSHPWDPRTWNDRGPLEGWLTAGARGQYVAHNISLDGSTLNADRHVSRVPGVFEYEFGAGLRLARVTLTYRAVTRTREYATGPAHHTYGSMAAGIDFVP
jgi:lipid A 3-O-deacylase